MALLLLPFVALLALRARSRRHLLLAVGAGALAVFAGEAVFLGPPVAALTFLAVVEDPARRPVTAWLAAGTGAVVSIAWAGFTGTTASVIPFVTVIIGAITGHLVRSVEHSQALKSETSHLHAQTRRGEEQTRWLEQRTSLARELHDVVGHHVTAMVVQAEAGLVARPAEALHSIGDHGRRALGELDALVVHLRDPDAELAITAPPRLSDVEEILAEPLRTQGVDVEVLLDPSAKLDEIGVLTLYRITQEALTNVARHAGASHAWVEIAPSGPHVRLRVSDDGIGPPDELDRGSGLIGMEERVHALGGIWAWSARPGGGTMVDVFLPAGTTVPDGRA